MAKDTGFSLIEVLVAVVIMGFLAIGASVTPMAIRNLRQNSETRAVAIHLAGNVIEQYRATGFTAIASQPAWQSVDMFDGGTSSKNSRITYQWQTLVQGFDIVSASGNLNLTSNGTNPEVRRVTVTVRWPVGAAFRQVQLSALIAP